MFTTKEIVEKCSREEFDSLRCDLCKINLLKKKQDDDEVAVAVLTLIKTTAGDLKQNLVKDAQGVYERESCELCEKCYKKVIEFLKGLGAKVPSFFFTDFLSCDDEETEDS